MSRAKIRRSLLYDENLAMDSEVSSLKDFKYFITSQREPKAIARMNNVCLLFILIFTVGIAGLIFNYYRVNAAN
jgi:hypothetical protein